jgi:antitoxin component YwqK of YwqJK toxin-antitoxin module
MKLRNFILFCTIISLCACQRTQLVEERDQGMLVKYEVDKKTGEKHGVYRQYNPDGNIFEEANYRHDILHGERVIYYPDGTPEIREHYHTGTFHGPYITYYENAQVEFRGDYVDGVMQGKWKKYYKDGQLMEVVQFEDNEENGPFVEYHRNGELKAEGNYYHGDNEHGLLKLYDENGALARKMECDSGICHTIWIRDSTIVQ